MNKEIDLTKPLAKVTIQDMVFTPITMDLEKPTKCNFCGSVRKKGGLICHVPLVESDFENTIFFYLCGKSCHTKFKNTKDINTKIKDVMMRSLIALREKMKGGED